MAEPAADRLTRLVELFEDILAMKGDPRLTPEWKALSKQDKHAMVQALQASSARRAAAAAPPTVPTPLAATAASLVPPLTPTHPPPLPATGGGMHAPAMTETGRAAAARVGVKEVNKARRAREAAIRKEAQALAEMVTATGRDVGGATGDGAAASMSMAGAAAAAAGTADAAGAAGEGADDAAASAAAAAAAPVAAPPRPRNVPAPLSPLAALFYPAVAGLLEEPPPEAVPVVLYHPVRLMMHGAGDTARPAPAAAVLLLKDAIVFARRTLAAMRTLLDRASGSVLIRDWVALMPEATRIYFRWRTLKSMTRDGEGGDREAAATATATDASAGGGVGGSGVGDDDAAAVGAGADDGDGDGHGSFVVGGSGGSDIEDNGPLASGATSPAGAGGLGGDEDDDGAGEEDARAFVGGHKRKRGAGGGGGAAGGGGTPVPKRRRTGDVVADAAASGDGDAGDSDDQGGDVAAEAAQSTSLPVIAPDDEEDELQLAMMTAQAEEDLRRGTMTLPPVVPTAGVAAAAGGSRTAASGAVLVSSSTSSVTATGATSSAAPQSAPVTNPQQELLASDAWRIFTERLAAFNARSAGMNTVQYAVYAWARKAGFTGTPKTKLAFAGQLAAPALTSASLEVLAYLTFDRLCSVVEAAGKLAPGAPAATLGASASASAGDSDGDCECIPLHAYEAAVAALPPLPHELNRVFEEMLEEDACRRQREEEADEIHL